MAGSTPNEGETLALAQMYKNITTDRGINLDLVLFTNAAVNVETITAATLTQPTGGGYAPILLTDANWNTVAVQGTASYAQQTFTAGAGGFTGAIYGYAILTKGTTPRILDIEIDAAGPYTMVENSTYKITPSITLD